MSCLTCTYNKRWRYVLNSRSATLGIEMIKFDVHSSFGKVVVISVFTLLPVAISSFKIEHYVNPYCGTADYERSVFGFVIPKYSDYGIKHASTQTPCGLESLMRFIKCYSCSIIGHIDHLDGRLCNILKHLQSRRR